MSTLARPPLPARRSSGVPPPPPPRRASKVSDDEETEKPMGIAARIASLQLNHVAKAGKPVTPTKQVQPVTPEGSQGEDEEDDPVVPPPPPPRRKSIVPKGRSESIPPPPPRQKSTPVPTRQPTWEEIEARGHDFVRAVSRKPPPIPSEQTHVPPAVPGRRLPPKPARLPTPPPEPEPEPDYDEAVEEEESSSCLKCHDFSFVDDHAAQFPRETVVSLDQLAYDLTCPWESETEKCRAIFTWLHHNIAYDAESFFGGNVQPCTPESTLRTGLGVCDGYATLFADLATRAGLQAMKVTGHGKGFGYIATEAGGPLPQYQGNHAWNCALMDGDWRLVDSCWGAGSVNGAASGYVKGFNPSWFTYTNAEFGKKHYPEDPGYQLLSDEEGGPVSWEDYILEEEGPLIFNDFHTNKFSARYIQPSTKYIQGGTWVSFHLLKLCEHLSTADADNYVHLICMPDESRTPMVLNPESGGWSADIFVPAGGGDLSLFYVTKIGEDNAKGVGVKDYTRAVGRKGMAFGGLCRWTVV
ncbi:hypothetical protein BDP27DRAFT_1321803 [Rhodocollybia butyracea]|uniref:Transglutaminase-like domain-containing protein n=1 Tax=Rhodocollybia butyracea TaxID=206335 RepID=A0A9P5PYR1_9AGAR|nr:hypothetical protein BDP27DRAFT_1321803 [Rhodocollybia butyracea]